MDKVKVGDKCSWSTLVNGKIARLTGVVKNVPDDTADWPLVVTGCDIHGNHYRDLVLLSDKSLEFCDLSD